LVVHVGVHAGVRFAHGGEGEEQGAEGGVTEVVRVVEEDVWFSLRIHEITILHDPKIINRLRLFAGEDGGEVG